VKELLERIEAKLDGVTRNHEDRLAMLERQAPPITNGEIRMANIEAEISKLDTQVGRLVEESHERYGGDMSTKKLMATVSFAVAVSGTLVGIVVALINSAL
jgi:predicted nuclease with TOPRIM domain